MTVSVFCDRQKFIEVLWTKDLGAANGKATVRKPRFSFSVAFQPVLRSLFVRKFSGRFAVTRSVSVQKRSLTNGYEFGLLSTAATH